ncbi:MAG: PQQ-binding-like beta-propeller repeat protein [Thermoplasmatota archaeon]
MIRSHGFDRISIVFIVVVACILMSNLPVTHGDCSALPVYDTPGDQHYLEYDRYLSRYDPSDMSFRYPDYRGDLPSDEPFVDVVMTPSEASLKGSGGLMDSAWPMYSHDVRHTGRSPYSTVNTTGVEKWWIAANGPAEGGPTIDKDGVIYIGSYQLSAVYPNGTLKWKFTGQNMLCAPAIAEDGTIYFGSIYGNRLYALYPNGTVKWTYPIGGEILSSPAIGDDGTIYIGGGQSIHAVYPNGTMKWKFTTNHVVYSSPAIGTDGTIYCGSHDTYLYALYPENGTMKWRYKTGDWVRVGPCIADDGTIYAVSFDKHLHAVYPNGTMKWKTNLGQAGTSPTIGWDGTIYCGYRNLHAINPEDGSVKWIYDAPGTIEGGTPCHSLDGTIYLATWQGGNLVAVNPDGTEQWRRKIGWTDSPPAIGADGTVYVGSGEHRRLLAFGGGPVEAHANGPYTGYYQEPVTFNGVAYGGLPPYNYHWDFGDGNTSNEQKPSHSYRTVGIYEAVLTATDSKGNQSSDNATVTICYRAPAVSIIRPSGGIYLFNIKILDLDSLYVVLGRRITIEVNATQWPLGIDRVEFYIDGELRETVTVPPYRWTLKDSLRWWGEKILLEVKAYGNDGQSSVSRRTIYQSVLLSIFDGLGEW